jgi:hypothetical protein
VNNNPETKNKDKSQVAELDEDSNFDSHSVDPVASF